MKKSYFKLAGLLIMIFFLGSCVQHSMVNKTVKRNLRLIPVDYDAPAYVQNSEQKQANSAVVLPEIAEPIETASTDLPSVDNSQTDKKETIAIHQKNFRKKVFKAINKVEKTNRDIQDIAEVLPQEQRLNNKNNALKKEVKTQNNPLDINDFWRSLLILILILIVLSILGNVLGINLVYIVVVALLIIALFVLISKL